MATFDPKTGFITDLDPTEVIVYGSNGHGNNAGGLAYYAEQKGWTKSGVVEGIAPGYQGYAVNTMDGFNTLIRHLTNLLAYVSDRPNTTFLLTKIGQGIAGLSAESINNALTIANYQNGHSALPINLIKIGW
jgi:hypothetical protein